MTPCFELFVSFVSFVSSVSSVVPPPDGQSFDANNCDKQNGAFRTERGTIQRRLNERRDSLLWVLT